MSDDDKVAWTAAAREGGDDLAQRVARIGERRVGADLEIRGELQGVDEIRAGRRPQPRLRAGCGRAHQEPLRARTDPAEIFGKRVRQAVIAVMRVEGPAEHQADIVDDVEDRDQPERRVIARRQIRDRELPGERPNRRRLAREARVG